MSIIVKIIKEFEFETYRKIVEEYVGLYKTFPKKDHRPRRDIDIERVIELVSSNIQGKVFVKKKVDLENINFCKVELIQEPLNYRVIIKPNKKKIAMIFKYKAKEVARQIKLLNNSKLDEEDLDELEILVNGKKMKLKENLFVVSRLYEDYKTIVDNPSLALLR